MRFSLYRRRDLIFHLIDSGWWLVVSGWWLVVSWLLIVYSTKRDNIMKDNDNSYSLTTNHQPPDTNQGHRQRLRERFLKNGAQAVADYELLEMVLFAASARSDTKPIAKKLIAHFGDFAKVAHAEPEQLAKIDGVGEAAIASIKIIHAAAERMLKAEASQGKIIQSWTSLLDYCRVSMGHKKIEEFRVLFLNNKNALISDEVQQSGTINHAPVYPREVVKRALDLNASAIILAHNHPSGDPNPSKEDIEITRQIITAATSLGISVHDHLIIAGNKYYSFKSSGLI
ncbi:MAG: DNA repair protein RadC [Pseudomonadota bacterium]